MKSSELVRKLKKDGWYKIDQTGSHMKMRHPTKKNQLTVPFHGSKEVSTGLANSIMKQAGLKK